MTPFKVICISSGCWYCVWGQNILHGGPSKNDIDMVVEVVEHYGETFFRLERFPDHCGFDSHCFRRLDEYPDATSEILKDFNPDKVEQEIVNPVKKVEV